MGNSTSSGPLVIEDDPLYILQDGAHQFSKEKSIRYRVGNRTCPIRVRANYNNNQYCDKINFVLFDFCDGDEARVDLTVGTERDSNRCRRLGGASFTYQGEVSADRRGENQAVISYGCFLREGLMIIEGKEEALHIAHNYFVIDRDQCLSFFIEI
ncbi:hypothetical protein L6164_000603 [Bauhinia variegata]|uniref:Uncharacterized protein n=1 Tax=Bauhinia variegata TaxID=167791 RepID=A0ACB9Q6Z4_BAUVA|nr:hypothetical protein L6164_000603 [Bauhinia variegata]